jgi:hypothetical protein
MSDRRPTLQAVIEAAKEAGRKGIYTWAPARVVKWDADKQRADCQILVKQVYRDEEDERRAKSWPVVTGVPVEFPGAGGYRITFPISDGNTVIDGARAAATTGALMFSHVSLDKWLSGNGREVDPELDHTHALTDAKFFPGLHPFGSPWGDVPTDHMTIGHDSGVQAHYHQNVLTVAKRADEAAATAVALADLVLEQLTDIATALLIHTHSGVTTGVGNSGGSNSTYVADTVAAEQLKAK